jgi:hypothetical protein
MRPDCNSKGKPARARGTLSRSYRRWSAAVPALASMARSGRRCRVALRGPVCNVTGRIGLIGIIILIISATGASAQAPTESDAPPDRRPSTSMAPNTSDADCGRCHFCDQPTRQNPCLLTCTRQRGPTGDLQLLEQQGLNLILLDELEDAYLPVPFDHRGHAEMAEMVGGCLTCHHYTPEGWRHPACKTCHEVSGAGADIDKPGLLGAYHQQCLNCHREWINERDCDVCHRAKTGRSRTDEAAATPTKDDLLRVMHPPIAEPDGDVYRSRSDQPTETQVIFRHRDHTHRFGLRCVECHHESSCAQCHTGDRERRSPRTLSEHHSPCVRCHTRDMDLTGWKASRCNRCHWRQGQPKPEPFDHAATGWALGRFHKDRTCRDCHKQLPFQKLDGDCNTCHSEWSPSAFDHRVTGQILDEIHAEQDCDTCHADRRFDRPPTCNACHDPADDGITFPAKRPGAYRSAQ